MNKKKQFLFIVALAIGLLNVCFSNSLVGDAAPNSDVTISFSELKDKDQADQQKKDQPKPSPTLNQNGKGKLPQLNELLTSMILILLGIALLILAISIVALKKIIALQERRI